MKLGNSGVDVSRICLGMMSFGKPGSENGVFPWAMEFDDAKPLFRRAVELGINFFDTANVYQLGSSDRHSKRIYCKVYLRVEPPFVRPIAWLPPTAPAAWG